MSLQIIFSDSTRPSGEEFVVLRELRGRATLPSRHVGGTRLREPSFNSSFSSEFISLASEIPHLSDGEYYGGIYDDGDYDDGDYDDGDYDDGDDDDDCDDCFYDDDDYDDYDDSEEVYCFFEHEIVDPTSSTQPPADGDSVRNPDEDSPRANIVSRRSRKSIIDRADLLREEARTEEKERDRRRAQRKTAWSEKRYADAIKFKVEQDEASERAKSLHRRAAEQYFKAHNLRTRDRRTIDVHRLRPVEATRRTEVAIRDARLAGATRVRVICGRGNHSKGGIPVLKHALIGAMEQCKIKTGVDPNNPGVLNIRLPVS